MVSLPVGNAPDAACLHIRELTLRACTVAHSAAGAVAEGIATGVNALLETVRSREIELDRLDREIDSAVTTHIAGVSESSAREMLACMKLSISIERIGDLLLGFSNRAMVAAARCEMEDVRDLTLMASRLEKMLSEVREAFETHNLDRALAVLRSDAEIDRLRNLVFVRHLENPERIASQRKLPCRVHDPVAGAGRRSREEYGGGSMPPGQRAECRHLLRSIDKPLEQMFLSPVTAQTCV